MARSPTAPGPPPESERLVVNITVINPNTTRTMTELIGSCARGVARSTIDAVNPSMGPASIESHFDEALAVPGILECIAAGEARNTDGYVIACFGDPGLFAAREVARGPVVGIAEAAMHVATLVGRSFAVVTTLSRTEGTARDLVRAYGFEDACRSISSCDIPVLELENPRSDARRVVADLCATAVADGADSVVLGCAGMADLCADLTDRIGVPVIDGVTAAVTLVESLVALGLTTSRRDEFAPPIPKPITCLLAGFARPAVQSVSV